MIADVVDPSNGIKTYIEDMDGAIAEWDAELQVIGKVKFSDAILFRDLLKIDYIKKFFKQIIRVDFFVLKIA